MGNWERIIPFDAQCDVPECPDLAALCFLPVFESPGGWTGEGRWKSEDNIGFVCEPHYEEGQQHPGSYDGNCLGCGAPERDCTCESND